jgi:hypothetical protein
VLGAALALAACGDADRTTTTSSSTTRTTVDPSGPPVTVGIICSDPTDAATSLVQAWAAGDRAAAGRCAVADVVAELFRRGGAAGWAFQGCGGPDPGVPVCTYSYPGGSAILTVEGTEAMGWKVTRVRLD